MAELNVQGTWKGSSVCDIFADGGSLVQVFPDDISITQKGDQFNMSFGTDFRYQGSVIPARKGDDSSTLGYIVWVSCTTSTNVAPYSEVGNARIYTNPFGQMMLEGLLVNAAALPDPKTGQPADPFKTGLTSRCRINYTRVSDADPGVKACGE